MAISYGLRQGIGLDIEFSESTLHYVGNTDDEDDDELAVFIGMIVKIPFVYFYWGEFYVKGSE